MNRCDEKRTSTDLNRNQIEDRCRMLKLPSSMYGNCTCQQRNYMNVLELKCRIPYNMVFLFITGYDDTTVSQIKRSFMLSAHSHICSLCVSLCVVYKNAIKFFFIMLLGCLVYHIRYIDIEPLVLVIGATIYTHRHSIKWVI